MRSILFLLLSAEVVWSAPAKKPTAAGAEFIHDAPDQPVSALMLENEFFYEPGVLATDSGAWLTWLEFQPGKGDLLWAGLQSEGKWLHKQPVTPDHGSFTKPSLTRDSKGRVWLTYETGLKGQWDLYLHSFDGRKTGPAQRISNAEGSDINHTVVPDSRGGLWIVWQSDQKGQFDIMARYFDGEAFSEIHTVSSSPRGDWQPSAAITPDDRLLVAWDSYDGTSYNVLARRFHENSWSHIATLAGSPLFEGRTRIVANRAGDLFITWEEDGANWGKHYIARTAGNKDSTRMGDSVGPLHRYRKLHFAQLHPETLQLIRRYDLPQPSLAAAAKRPNALADVQFFGAFYERAQLVVDGEDRPWIVYRHYYAPWLGIQPTHHVETDFHLYARCLMTNGWSDLIGFNVGQGDGMQRLSVSPTANGFAAAWTTGRTDRNKYADRPRGIALADVSLPGNSGSGDATLPPTALTAPSRMLRTPPRSLRPQTRHAGKSFQLHFGDLHRHTDVSLCYTPSDGTTEDAYRYAIDAAPLDFLGITDHTHDLQMGEPLSQLWWRAVKETDRHKLSGGFITFYSYERSRGDTDHNVISLRPDRMRPHTYPLPDFWQELDSDTFTIPHEPFKGAVWKHKDNAHRPLLEIYQGYRDTSAEEAAHEALSKGHQVGFIASSDHLSTSASFAGVWAEESTRESVFRAMQARRTYGATARIPLKVTCGDHWMGERFTTKELPPIRVEVTPTAAITAIECFTNGKLESSVIDLVSTPGALLVYEWKPKPATGPNIHYVRITQKDGNRAWSSPIWADVK